MRLRQLILSGIFLFLISISPLSYAVSFAGQTPKILPLGDSITSGRFEPSYRYWLKQLSDASTSVKFDFTGTLNSNNPPPGFTDDEHEGWSGYTARDLLTVVHPDSTTGQSIIDYSLATLGPPDITLIHLGTNNFQFTFEGFDLDAAITAAITDLSDLIAKIRAAKPDVVILLAQIIPIADDAPNNIPGWESGAPNIPPYNDAIAQLASDLNTATSPVVLVDQYTGFDQTTDLLSDGIHPTDSGELKLAQKWFAALEPFFAIPSNANWPLNENSGTTAFDQSTNMVNLTVNNGASWVPGQSGSALEFAGPASLQDASSTNATALQTPSITLSAWIYPDTTSESWEWVASQGDNVGLYLTPNDGKVYFYVRNTVGGWSGVSSPANSFQFNQWQHIAGSFDDATNTLKVYINGVEAGSNNSAQGITYNTGNGFTIGSMQHQRFFDGRIDDVKVFDSALSQAEVSQLADLPLPCNTTYTLPHNRWRQISLPCDPGSSNTVADIFGDDELGIYDQDWVLWEYIPATNSYTNVGLSGTLSQGKSYWMAQLTGSARVLDMPATSTPTPATASAGCLSEACFESPLATQANDTTWNMVGYPFIVAVNVSSTRVMTNSGTCSIPSCELDTAAAENIVHNQLWTYNGADYSLITASNNLVSWTGYWAASLSASSGTEPKLLITKP